tara:strand:+ start:951 stop:1085 length:135 start_codon:yes stop_codon:yes gene_type:complete
MDISNEKTQLAIELLANHDIATILEIIAAAKELEKNNTVLKNEK